MKSWELLRELFAPKGVKLIASRLGLSRWLVHKWTQPAGDAASGTRNPLDMVVLLMQMTDARRLAQWVCQQCGGYFVPNPPARPLAPTDLLPATGGVMRELALLQAELAASVRDSNVSPAEAAAKRQKWEGLKADMEAYLRQCEGKAFRPQPGPVRSAAVITP